ncbi:MAG: efflux RND transporter periplasmic adaptor subunit [Myxococcales bacterium]|nr:efflux RND transporter periplasmic adaptor subunit [Myxococcales bacterium]
MNRVARQLLLIVAGSALLLAGYLVFFAADRTTGTTLAEPEQKPSPTVETAVVRRGTIETTLDALGTAVPWLAKKHVYSLPFECRVLTVQVTKGQLVAQHALMLSVKPSLAAQLTLQQATNEYNTALALERLARQRAKLKLALRTEVIAAQSLLKQKELILRSLKAQGLRRRQIEIRTVSQGMIHEVGGHVGQLIPSGSSLVEVLDGDHILIRFGVESRQLSRLKPGMPVRLTRIHDSHHRPIAAKITAITQTLDPTTRLVAVLALPEKTAGLALNDFVEVRVVTASHIGLLVPKSALLPHSGGYRLFTVVNGHAKAHRVTKGLENAKVVEVIGAGINVGDRVVVLGNYELTDGMRVIEATKP